MDTFENIYVPVGLILTVQSLPVSRSDVNIIMTISKKDQASLVDHHSRGAYVPIADGGETGIN